MKILQLTHNLGNGGAEKIVVELSNELAKSNEVTLCSVLSIEDWMLPPKKISKAVNVIELRIGRKFSLILLLKMARLIKHIRPDVVHIHSSILVFYLYLLSGIFRRVCFLQTIHSTITPGYTKLLGFLNKMRFINPDFHNICISKNIENQFRIKFPKLNFTQIDNGIEKLKMTENFAATIKEVERFKKDKNTKVFIAIGNYSDFKNFIMLSELFNELERTKTDVLLLLIGAAGPAERANYEEVARIKGDNTFQLGLKDNVADYLGYSDAMIMSSTKEGMPLVVLEALSFGLPVISTPAGGVIDVIENEVNGIIAKGFDKKDLIEAIQEFLNLDEKSIKRISENNKTKFIQNYTIEQCAEKYIRLAYSAR